MGRKYRVLCLHGWKTNKEIMDYQINAGFGKLSDEFEYIYIDAPVKVDEPVNKAIEKLNTMLSEREGRKLEYFMWHTDHDSKKGVCHYFGFYDAMYYILDFIKQQKEPFDFIIGFSQAGVLLAWISTLIALTPTLLHEKYRWRANIYICSFAAEDPNIIEHMEMAIQLNIKLPFQNIYMLGKEDKFFEWKQYQHFFDLITRLNANERGQCHYIEFPEGHKVPSAAKSATEISICLQKLMTMAAPSHL